MSQSKMDTEKQIEAEENAFIVKCLLNILDLPATQKEKIVTMVVSALIKGGGRDFLK